MAGLENVTWPDDSLGNPEPGMLYTNTPTEGVRIILSAQCNLYEYRAGGPRGPFLSGVERSEMS